MRILLLTTHLNFGGIASYTVSLAEELQRRGHDLTVGSSGGDMVPRLKRAGVNHLRLSIRTKSEASPKVLLTALKLLGRIKEFDIIHSQTRVTQVLAAILSALGRVPCVATGHGFFRPKLSRLLFPAWGKKTIAISEAVRAHLVKDFRLRKENCPVVHNGVDVHRFGREISLEERELIRREYQLRGSFIIGLIARLSPVKGQRYLVRALDLLLKQNLPVELLLIGDGPDKEMLIDLVKKLGIEDTVRFAPSTVDTTRPLSIMDVFVLPSVQEGLGISLAEAMAAGVAVVASDVGGIYSLVRHHRTGLLVPAEDPAALAEAIKELISNENLRKSLAAAGQKLIAKKFSIEEMGKKTEKVYEDACIPS